MALSSTPWPTFAQVREHLVTRCNCTYRDLSSPGYPGGVFERRQNGKTYQAPVGYGDNEQLSDLVIGQICRRLGISPASLGVVTPDNDDGVLFH